MAKFMPPPGLELPYSVGAANATVSEQEFCQIYKEYLQLRQECQDSSKPAFINRSAELDAERFPAPQKPPGVFVKSGSTYSLASTVATATADGDLGQQLDDVHFQQAQMAPVPHPKPAAATETKYTADGINRELCLERLTSQGHLKVKWPIDAKKLQAKDQQIVSPSFEIFPGCSFRIMLKPVVMGDKKGQACFKKARGWGSVDLKMAHCTGAAPTLCFRISVGDDSPKGPVSHDFNESIVGSLSKDHDKFNFASAVDKKTSTVQITLEVLQSTLL
jgi:hypothetical protein